MVLSSKLTFLIITVTALLFSGSAMLNQDAFAAIDAPEFTCKHINTTATHCTFDQSVNGTLAILDWTIRNTSTITAGDILTNAQGADGTTITITNIQNSTSAGIGQTAPGTVDKKTGVSSGTGVVGLGYINGTDFVMIHSAIKSDETYFINYTNNAASLADAFRQFGQIHANEQAGVGAGGQGGSVGTCVVEAAGCKYLKIGSNATAADWMEPTAVSAKKTGPKKIEVLMSETVANINSTGIDFTLYGLHDSVVSSIIATNGTQTIYLTTQNLIDPVNDSPAITLSYNSDADGDNVGIDHWITDAIDSTRYANSGVLDSLEW